MDQLSDVFKRSPSDSVIMCCGLCQDRDMYHEDTDTPAVARTSNLNEELGQVLSAVFFAVIFVTNKRPLHFVRICRQNVAAFIELNLK